MATAEKLGNIATNIVLEKVAQDKLKAAYEARCQDQKPEEEAQHEANEEAEGGGDGLIDISHWREKRMQQIKEARNKQDLYRQQGHGKYEEIVEEEFLPAVTKSKLAICHFFSPTFDRCKVMDKHLTELALLHLETRFMKINAEKAPFFSQKLHIRCLPSVVLFKDGIAVHTIVGFTELGGVDDFRRAKLERLLLKYKVVERCLGDNISDESDDESDNN
ncbi:thioredoxin domain-containing protein [Toxoplasma gondii TgCatPRC2]|uniref:Thioredoxin domain-containing protein n=15 Tax=Toxoplasma gondii TaxID=5811 RepID=B9PTA4_TOXGV|nr:thioredoxin domain-containing protein [Toxoplasma gondii ME49]EPR59672.1 thioredoxin domain-containing protein [Toxoplasma gondii GT1]ESS34004.1 thioredoxin domain-containing protein [Toxoplasma gondii VEG]KAF4644577.1 thioredoxin domain-containing protein [Toxoplasma gondii]KFG30849.1 thioredoxin domain-containing protein [Toxoplasma gondii p89]KFG41664.1 thioredoxin domain-containing protein [Toxoplasma gondii FOU]KFG42147.1 thioredoxin domain-containing protein [Toxoplasma gondii GAB2-2|eukprot:XP_002368523.1 thioredoxin domain-containing protein [Toxoplasma gondii ME49]